MTTTVKVHVNGLYVAAIKNTTTNEITLVGPNEEKVINILHGSINDLRLEEKYIGDQEWFKEYEARKLNFLNPEVSQQE